MTFSAITDARIRQIQTAAVDRAAKRAEEAAKLAERQANEEIRTSVSPRDLERQAALKAAAEFWERFHEQERLREYNRQGKIDVKTMETLKSEWDQPETTPVRRGQIVRRYGLLYRKYRPKITDEMLLAAWEDQRLMAMRKKVYGATK